MSRDDQTNILFITLDELHREALSCYGATAHQTQNIDMLSQQGTQYTRAYTASPICLPSRCSVMTGLYPHNTRSYSNVVGRSLGLGLPNAFRLLGEAGYRTSKHGKCHFVPVPYSEVEDTYLPEWETVRAYYEQLGMDHLDLQDDKNISRWFYDDYAKELEAKHPQVLRDYKTAPDSPFTWPGPEEVHPDSWVGRRTVDYIRDYSADAPAFVWASFSGPHYPIDPPAEYLSRVDMSEDHERHYREDEWENSDRVHELAWHGEDNSLHPEGRAESDEYARRWRHHYYANVVQIDDYIGDIVAAAEQQWGDSLLVVFTADHGEMMCNHGFWGKNNCLFEDVLRVPLIVRSPGQQNGGTFNGIVSLVDLLPTFLSAADRDTIDCDGRSLAEWRQEGGREYAISGFEGRVAITDGERKLSIYRTGAGERVEEFYDLEADPYEFENRISDPDYETERTRLRGELDRVDDEDGLYDVYFYNKERYVEGDIESSPPWLASQSESQ